MIRYSINRELKKHYIKKLQTDKDQLPKASKQFIEDILLINEDLDYDGIGDYWEAKTKERLAEQDHWALADIFPKEVYPALDLMIGETHRKEMIDICDRLTLYPYTIGYYRRMMRSTNYRHHFNRIIHTVFSNFIEMAILDMDSIDIIKQKVQDYYDYSSITFPDLIAYQIDQKNQEIIDIIKEMILSENNTLVLSRMVIDGIIRSHNSELVELLGKLLLAAKLQEGLRQHICEAMDGGLQENFVYLFDIVYENNLMRFSSVKRAIGTFTSIGEDDPDRITKKELELIQGLNHGKIKPETLLASKDNVETLLGLWKLGSQDITQFISGIDFILKNGKRHSHLLVSYAVDMINDEKYQFQVAKAVIKKYGTDSKEKDGDLTEIVACYLPYFMKDSYGYYAYDEALKKLSKSAPLFADEQEAELYFNIFERVINYMPKKEISYYPCIFPWNQESMNKNDIARIMGAIAYLYPKKLKNRMIDYVKNMDYGQFEYIKVAYGNPTTQAEKRLLIDLLGTRGSQNLKIMEIIKENDFAKEYIEEIAGYFRLKTPEIRQAIIELLSGLSDQDLKQVIESQIQQKTAVKRLGALDLLLKAKQEQRFSLNQIKKMVAGIQKPTSSEQVLIDELLAENLSSEMISQLYDVNYQPKIDLDLSNHTDLKKLFTKTPEEIYSILEKLVQLFKEHEDYEYTSGMYGEDTLLSRGFYAINRKNYWEREIIDDYPLAEVWKKFYQDEIKDFNTLYQIKEMFGYTDDDLDELEDLLDSDSAEKPFIDLNKMLGMNMWGLGKLLKQKPLDYCSNSYTNNQVYKIVDLLFSTMELEHQAELFDISKSIMEYYFSHYSMEDAVNLEEYWNGGQYLSLNFDEIPFINHGVSYLRYYQKDEEFKQAFSCKYEMDHQLLEKAKKEKIDCDISFINITEMAYAIHLKMLKPDAFYHCVLDYGKKKLDTEIDQISEYLDGSYSDRMKRNKTMVDSKPEAIAFVKEHGQKIIDYLIALELKRGDLPLETSQAIHKIKRMEGIDNLIAVLNALGNLKLDRNSWYWNGSDTKQATLSHLLKVSYPLKTETVKDLKQALKGGQITEQRLTEVAMYAPQWIPLLEEYLGWKGLASGCYYFQAHTSDIDRRKEGLFAKYTPIAMDDLEVGAFDIEWFKSAYAELGAKHFDMLYESAKYISDGAKHGRARKFADAVLGKLKVKPTEVEIQAKRNKDLLASYSLIPLAKNKQKDLLRRYKFLQKFLKDSKQFGAQRRSSEAKAFQISLENLARNAGYSDVTRLTWTMETDLIDEIKEFFKPHAVGDIKVYIQIDKNGKSSILCEKGEKPLKSLPTKYKKDKYVLKLKEAHKGLKDQYSRSKKMLEEAMEDVTLFESGEIDNLLKNNPVIAPLLKDLVMKHEDQLGYYRDGKLISIHGKTVDLKPDSLLSIAHALDLYRSGDWSDYQKDLFDRQIKQPFKQVFREIYVKTEDELGKFESRRYAGHQIQPTKTIAVLKNRRWVVDGEEGLQKVYYQQNIIAKIYALADWFSPADIEAPTLEWVQFYDRKTFKPMKMDDVPDLIFTEVMRDVDLAVSVAHVGGVDPETSHSTIEMRKAIVQFNLPLFKLENVSFTEKHALIKGKLAEYSIHLGSGVIHQKAGAEISVLPVHSQHRGRVFLPFIDEDPKTAEIMTKVIFFAQDSKIKDPSILKQIKQ